VRRRSKRGDRDAAGYGPDNPAPGVEYRDVVGFVGYKVDSEGSLWGCRKLVPIGYHKGTRSELGSSWRKLKTSVFPDGYLGTALRKHPGSRPTSLLVHTLVLTSFRGPRPPGLVCRHLDGNPINNRLDNLAWGTWEENEADKLRHGTRARGESQGHSRFKEEEVKAIRLLAANGFSLRKLGRMFDANYTTIGGIVQRKSWRHI
jgi:hypothetical protein